MPEGLINGYRMHYEVHGTGQPLVMIHGGWGGGEGCAAMVKHHAECFAASFGLIFYDRRSAGLSENSAAGYDMEVGRQDSQFGLPLQGELRRRWLADALAGRFLSSSQLTGTVVEDLYVDPHVQRIYGDEGLTLGYSTPVRNSRGKVIAVWKNFAVWSLVEDMFHSIYAVLKKQNLGSAELSLLNSKDPSSWTMTRQSAGRLTCGATGLCPCNTCGDFSAWKPDKSPGTACFAL